MVKIVSLEELKGYVGKQIGLTGWLTIEQERINMFAECVEDRQYIHVNEELAKKTPYGTTIAHGFMILGLCSFFNYQNEVALQGVKTALNYGTNKVRFMSPVKRGSRVRSRAVLKEVTEKGAGRVIMVIENTIEIEGEEKPAMVAENVSMLMT